MKLYQLHENNYSAVLEDGQRINEAAMIYFESNGPAPGNEEEWSELEEGAIRIGDIMMEMEDAKGGFDPIEYSRLTSKLEEILNRAEEIEHE